VNRPATPSDLTPHWQRMVRHHGEAHLALQRVAEAIYQQAEEPLPASYLHREDLSIALELGVLTSHDNGIG
jgi:hypothetical protein